MKYREELITHLNIHRNNLDLLIERFADCIVSSRNLIFNWGWLFSQIVEELEEYRQRAKK